MHFTTNKIYRIGIAFGVSSLLLLFGLSSLFSQDPVSSKVTFPDKAVYVTIVYDNYQADNSLETDWGFACLVEYQGNKLLFDAGRNIALYKTNMSQLGINPETIPTLFISHEHGDHTAGIPWIIEVNPSVNCFLPASYAEQLKANGTLPPNSKAVKKPSHLYGPFYSTGDDFVTFREQGLVIKTINGGVLLTGCGHPGAVPMVKAAEKELGIEIHTIIGGLHLMKSTGKDLELIASELKEMGVRLICPTHCTGDNSIASLKASFGEGYISGGTGKEIIIQ